METDSSLKCEYVRLQTFKIKKWPEWSLISYDKLAKAGFYYSGIDDEVICFSCGGKHKNWKINDKAYAIHCEKFPTCSFVRQDPTCGNVPLVNFKTSTFLNEKGIDVGCKLAERNKSKREDILDFPDVSASSSSTCNVSNVSETTADSEMEFEAAGTRIYAIPRRFQGPSNLALPVSQETVLIPPAPAVCQQSHPQNFGTSLAEIATNAVPTVADDEEAIISAYYHQQEMLLQSELMNDINSAIPPAVFVSNVAQTITNTEESLMNEEGSQENSSGFSSRRSSFPLADAVQEQHTIPIRNLRNRNLRHRSPYFPATISLNSSAVASEQAANVGGLQSETESNSLSIGQSLFPSTAPREHLGNSGNNTDDEEWWSGAHLLEMINVTERFRSLVDQFENLASSSGSRSGSNENIVAEAINKASSSKSNADDVVRCRMEELGICIDKPKRPDLATFAARYQTFDDWSYAKVQNIGCLAEAGFYALGTTDAVKCFMCDISLYKWKVDEEPWAQHARWSPKCQFVYINKGASFISGVLSKFQKAAVASTNICSTSTSTESDIEITVVEELESCPKTALNSASKGNSELPKTLAELANYGVNASAEQISHALTFGYDENLILKAIISNRYKLFSSVVELIEKMEELRRKAELRIEDEQYCTAACSTNSSVSIHGGSFEFPKELVEEENRFLKEQRMCKICMDAEVSVVFLPCGHLVSCPACAPALELCPICRKAIKGWVRTFLA